VNWTEGAILNALLELGIIFPAARLLRLNVAKCAAVSIPLNMVTQPVFAVWLRNVLRGQDYLWWPYAAVGEVVVWLAEAAVYARFAGEGRGSGGKWLALSLLANATSFSVGLALPF
jgi:hypothetical protein